MNDTAERIEHMAFEHAQKVEALEDKLNAMQDERDEVIMDRDRIKGLFDLLNDQNVRIAQAMRGVRQEREDALAALSALVAAVERGGAVAPALEVARAVLDHPPIFQPGWGDWSRDGTSWIFTLRRHAEPSTDGN